jgi:hypothetical protein
MNGSILKVDFIRPARGARLGEAGATIIGDAVQSTFEPESPKES